MYKIKVTSKGQVTIPKKLREEMSITTGDYLMIRETKAGYVIEKEVDEEKLKNYVGILNQKGSSDQKVRELRGNENSN